MYLDLKTLLKLPVVTESGIELGRVHELEIDTMTHAIRRYVVEHGFIGKESYRIAPVQIRAITSEKIIVDDAVIKEGVKKKRLAEPELPSEPALGAMVAPAEEN